MIRAVLFDVDGTLHDWETALADALDEVLPLVPAEQRDGLPERLRQATAEYAFVWRAGTVVDRRHWLFLTDPLPPWRAALGVAAPELVQQVAEAFRSALRAVPFADAPAALEALRPSYALGVLSNSPRGRAMLEALGLKAYFDTVVDATRGPRKPDPRAFQLACEALGVSPGETAYVGDSLSNDVEGALGAGLVPVWLDRYADRTPLPAGAYRVTSLLELPELLAGLSDARGAGGDG